MKPEHAFFALLTFVGFVAILPMFRYFAFASSYASQLQIEAQVLVALALPFMLGLYLAGWLQPGAG